jgi:uncharacterized protein (TIGR03118 family)
MQRRMIALTAGLGFLLMLVSSTAMAQYKLTNLDSNQIGQAAHADPLIVNGWGLVHGPGTPWWVADNNSGWSTLYDGTGKAQGLRVLLPTAGNGPDSPNGLNGPGSPTGVVFNVTAVNGANEFQVAGWPALFLFATLDGTISGWTFKSNANQAIVAVDTSTSNTPAVYTGLAITGNAKGNLLFAADMANNKIDVYDANFNLVNSFTDTSLPAGFAPFGIRDINGELYVTFASTTGGTGGFVDKFTEAVHPTLVGGKPLIQGAPLNQPWGIASAPKNFGPLSNTLLISNNTNSGTINAFDTISGQFVGTMKDLNGKTIVIDQLWGIDFGDGRGKNGPASELFFAAGPKNNLVGTFGSIVFK